MEGWVKLHRQLLNKPIWQCSTPEQKTILITLLLMASHKDTEWEWKGQRFVVDPGQFVTSLDSITKKSGRDISIQNVRTALKRFEKYEFLTNESTKSGRLITIVNWEEYQSSGTDTNNDTNNELTKSQQRPNKDLTPIKNVKNDKNVKKEREEIPYQEIADTYNSICKSFPRLMKLSEARKKAIRARLNTYTLEDFKTLFIMAEESDFLKGKNDRNWNATFDWLTKDSNMAKVLDGNYRNSTSKKESKSNNKFNQFPQREYKDQDYKSLEQKLLNRR